MDAIQPPLIEQRLAELCNPRATRLTLRRRYREFIALWDHADPTLQPKVADARHRLRRLSDVERK
jgi:hypothetical protein